MKRHHPAVPGKTKMREGEPARSEPASDSDLYGDPFAGICRHARDLPPRLRAERTRLCPRCGPLRGQSTGHDGGCILEGIALESLLLESG
jgi:hypothetical protein